MTLVIILNAVLAVAIVGVIVALHTAAILSDRPQRRRAAPVRRGPVPSRPQPRPASPKTSDGERVPVGV